MQPDPIFLVNAGVPISNAKPFTRVVQIPPNVDTQASGNQLAVRNTDASATMYFKWVNIGESTNFDVADAGIVLPPSGAWDTRMPPPGRELIGRSTVNAAICAVDGQAALKVR